MPPSLLLASRRASCSRSQRGMSGFGVLFLLVLLGAGGYFAFLWLTDNPSPLSPSLPQPRPLSDTKELDILRVTEVKNGPTALQIKIRLELLGFQNRTLTVKLTLRLRKEGGGDAVIDTYTLASLTPKYKLQRYDDYPLHVPYNQISVSPGSHRLYLDLRLFDPSGKLVAATLNKDFTLEIPEPPSSAPSSR